jgi:integral membrane protein (TIGR01906 family)
MTPKSKITSNFIPTTIKVFLTLVVPILLTIFSIRLVMSYQFFQFEYLRPDFPIDYYGFTTEDRLNYSPYAVDYLFNSDDINFLGDLRLPLDKCWQPAPNATDCPMYKKAALNHMVDVKVVTQTTFTIAGILSLITLAIFGVGYRYHSYHFSIRRGLTYGSVLTLSLIITIITLALTTWDFFFDTFHELFFEAGTWRFAFSDTLIRLYPERFWFDASITIGVLTTIGAFIILALMWQWSKRRV